MVMEWPRHARHPHAVVNDVTGCDQLGERVDDIEHWSPASGSDLVDRRGAVVDCIENRPEMRRDDHPCPTEPTPTIGVSPSATSTSSTPRTGAHPSANNPLVPAAAGLRSEPGTAITARSRLIASSTVRSEPPADRDSTTTTTSTTAAIRRRSRLGQHLAGVADDRVEFST